MATHFKGPLGAAVSNFGGLAEGIGILATDGMTDVVTVFDDFNDTIPNDSFSSALILEQMGWVLTDVGAPANDAIYANNAKATDETFNSCLYILPGTAVDAGGNMQLDFVNADVSIDAASDVAGPSRAFPHIWLPETDAGVAVMDGMDYMFACRIGLASMVTTWNGKLFIGWAEAGDTGILTAATGAIAQPETGPLVGFHVGEDGSIDGIAQRTVNTPYAAGTNFTEVVGTGWNSGLTAGRPVWFDLCLRIHVADQSDNANNGSVQFASRSVGSTTKSNGVWSKHNVPLLNQTPNNNVAMVPTIEVVNGPADAVAVYLDWWTFGCTRFSHT